MGIFWSGEPAKSHPKFLKWIAGHRPPAESDSPYKGACAAARHFWGRLRAAVIHRSLCVLCVFFLCKTHHKCLESCFHIAAWSYIINDINVFCFLFLRWRSVQRHLFWKRPTKTREMFVMALCGPKRTTSVDWLDTPDGLVMFHQNPLCQTAQILHQKKEGSWCGWDVSKKGAKELYTYPFCSHTCDVSFIISKFLPRMSFPTHILLCSVNFRSMFTITKRAAGWLLIPGNGITPKTVGVKVEWFESLFFWREILGFWCKYTDIDKKKVNSTHVFVLMFFSSLISDVRCFHSNAPEKILNLLHH